MDKERKEGSNEKSPWKKVLIHDLPLEGEEALHNALPEDVFAIAARKEIHRCIGCFGCWVKTPGVCILPDHGSDLAPVLGGCDELILLGRNVYGGLSPDVKTALDRVIGYILPFFRMVDGEMHHALRYDHAIRYRTYYYGEEIDESQKQIAWDLAQANAVNLGAAHYDVSFHGDAQGAKEAIFETLSV